MAYTIPKNAVNPQASRLLDGRSYSVSGSEGGIEMPYDFNRAPPELLQKLGDPNFYTQVNATDAFFDEGKQKSFAQKLLDSGYRVMQAGDSVGNGSYSWVEDADGNIIAEPQYVSNDDPAFKAGMLGAMAFTGASVLNPGGFAGLSGGGSAAPAAGDGALAAAASEGGSLGSAISADAYGSSLLGTDLAGGVFGPASLDGASALTGSSLLTGAAPSALAPSLLGGGTDFLGTAKDYVSNLIDTGVTGGKSLFGNNWMRDILGLVGAGVQQVTAEKMVQDQRDWVDKKEAESRRRRMPSSALKEAKFSVIPGGNRGS
jgi:hypothetical protein